MRSPCIFSALAATVLVACSSGPEVYENGNGAVALRVESSVDEVDVEELRVREKEGRATAQFNLVNHADDTQHVFVALEWFDRDGFQVEDSMEVDPRERSFELRGTSSRTLTFFSPDGADPVRLRCLVREAW